MRRVAMRETLLDATATAVNAGVRVTDYRTCVLSILGSPTANMKVFVKGSIGDTRPDFTVASGQREVTRANWDYLDVVDLEDNASIDGDTGIDLANNRVRNIQVNTDAFDWISVHATAVITGTVTVAGLFVTNE